MRLGLKQANQFQAPMNDLGGLSTSFKSHFFYQQSKALKNCYIFSDLRLDLLYSPQEISRSICYRAISEFSHSPGTGGCQMT